MAYKHFSSGLIIRIILISLLTLLMLISLIQATRNNLGSAPWWIVSSFFFLALLFVSINLFHYTNAANRKLALFFDAVRYDDFSIRFTADDNMGKSFRNLNEKFAQVQEAFKVARAENEASLHLLKTLISNIQTGLVVFDSYGRIELINTAACELLGYQRLKNISELSNIHPVLAEKLKTETVATGQFLYKTPRNQELSVSILPLIIREKEKKLVVFHNISEELQRKEVEAWQNLTRVLRHEIMNSLTPVLSLVGTMKHIVQFELPNNSSNSQPWHDLQEALETIELRGKGMIGFVETYRHFTTIPSPKLTTVSLDKYIPKLKNLLAPEIQQAGIRFESPSSLPRFSIKADPEQLTMVLINMFKNAREALVKTVSPKIELKLSLQDEYVVIEVTDNGEGIEPDAISQIFIPFFSTKKSGAGIGLSLSRQIIQQMGGHIKVISEPGKGSRFFLLLPEAKET